MYNQDNIAYRASWKTVQEGFYETCEWRRIGGEEVEEKVVGRINSIFLEAL